MWSTLTPDERDKFLRALNDPSSELGQQLLASEELEAQSTEPWWERPADHIDDDPQTTGQIASGVRRYGYKPNFVDIPTAAIKASERAGTSGPTLLYNICAVLCV